jgi:Leu/Phe-tRNA-protein transferase
MVRSFFWVMEKKSEMGWVQSMQRDAINGWKRRIQRRVKKGIRAQVWDIRTEHDPTWIKAILCPLLNKEGLQAALHGSCLLVKMPDQ